MGKQVWQAQDGDLFDTEKECLRHERASLVLLDMKDSEQYLRNEERWGFQKNFSRYFLSGFKRKENFWNYAESFRTLADILDGKRPDLPMLSRSLSKNQDKLLPSAKRKGVK